MGSSGIMVYRLRAVLSVYVFCVASARRFRLADGLVEPVSRICWALCGLVLQAPWSWAHRDVFEAQWPAVRNNTSTSSAAHITSSSLFDIDNLRGGQLHIVCGAH
jgi:hypothetical protein